MTTSHGQVIKVSRTGIKWLHVAVWAVLVAVSTAWACLLVAIMRWVLH